MKHFYRRTIVLLFVGLLTAQAALGNAAFCLCEDSHVTTTLPQGTPGCCSADNAPPPAPTPGIPTMETPHSDGCDQCVQVALSTRPQSERDLPVRWAAVGTALASASQSSSSGAVYPSPLVEPPCLRPPLLTVIRI